MIIIITLARPPNSHPGLAPFLWDDVAYIPKHLRLEKNSRLNHHPIKPGFLFNRK